jgi:UDP-N-acetylmuramoyl-tripeptide--D-alanyl-D-alanine ligase
VTAAATSNPILWGAEEAAAATGGQTQGTWVATGVSIDSRTVQPGDLFVAIEGPNFDGHQFVDDALGKGAAAAIVASRQMGDRSDNRLLVVDDCLKALESLGGAARGRTRARIIAVTGSVGKTGTKEALKMVLGRRFSVHATVGSLNNHWGLPLTLARLPEDIDFAVLELGMNHPGEISVLTKMARPHVAVITTVGLAHKEFFKTVEEIADAKAEIFEGVEPGGAAVLDHDHPLYNRLAAAAERAGVERIITFGSAKDTAVRLVAAMPGPEASDVTALVNGRTHVFRVGAAGKHWISNSLAVLAAVSAAGADVASAAQALADLRPPVGRGQKHRIQMAGGTFQLIDESYNANPIAMRAAIEVLGRALPYNGGRRIAVLGDMLELGDDSGDLHAELAGPLIEQGIDKVFSAGTDMSRLWEVLPRAMRGGHAADANSLTPMVVSAVGPGDVVMVKGSAGSKTGLIVEALKSLGSNGGDAPKQAVNGH